MEFLVDQHRWIAVSYGNGPQHLIALHGYGQDSSVFRHLADLIGDRFTFIAVDLAYHGQNRDLEKSFLFDREYAQKWMHSILQITKQEQAGLLGFSIGARISLFVASVIPSLINELWLIAPDGLPVSRAYRFLTATLVGHWVFRSFVRSPWFAFGLIRLGKALRLLSTKSAGFYLKETETPERRQQLYDTWMAYRHAIPDEVSLNSSMLAGKIGVVCILGKNDAVIPFNRTRAQLKKTLPGSSLIELNLGHNLLSDKAIRKLSEFFGNKKSDHEPLYKENR